MCQLGPRRSSRVSARFPAASRRRASRSARRRRAQSAGDGRGGVSTAVEAAGRRSIVGGALTGTGRAGRGKTVTATTGTSSLRALHALPYVLAPTRKQDIGVKREGVSGDEPDIHA